MKRMKELDQENHQLQGRVNIVKEDDKTLIFLCYKILVTTTNYFDNHKSLL